LKQALKRDGSSETIITDGLRSYRTAMKELRKNDKHEVGRCANNWQAGLCQS
jgi:putative transposase